MAEAQIDRDRRSSPMIRCDQFDIEITTEFDALETLWKQFETSAVASAYQRFDFQAAWQRTQGAYQDISPRIVVGRKDGETMFILPFGECRKGPTRTCEFLGGRHANFNLGLFTHGFADRVERTCFLELLQRIAEMTSPFDAYVLKNMPLAWDGNPNPLALPATTPTTSDGFKGALSNDYAALFKQQRGSKAGGKARRKLRRLMDVGEVAFRRVCAPDEMKAVLDVFLAQKSQRFDRLGLPNAFDEPKSEDFLAELVDYACCADQPILELYTLAIADDIYAVIGGSAHNGRFTVYFSSFREDRLSKYTPGELLLNHVVEECCKRGLTTLDLGVGEASYKSTWCKEPEPLVDLFLPVTIPGRMLTASLQLAKVAKRQIKKSPHLESAAKRMMHLMHH